MVSSQLSGHARPLYPDSGKVSAGSECRKAVGKEVREQGAGRKEAKKGRRGRCSRSTISNGTVKFETSGHERCQMGLDWVAVGHQEIHWESKQPEESESKEADLQTIQGSAYRSHSFGPKDRM